MGIPDCPLPKNCPFDTEGETAHFAALDTKLDIIRERKECESGYKKI